MMQKTLTRTLPALVWALALVALGAALLFALGDASAQQPPISASIVDDNDINTNSLCSGFVWSDGRCDLRIRVTDHDATDSDVTIVVSPIFSGAFDASVITPDDTALSSQTLGPTASTYTIPGNTRQIFRLRMTPVVTASGPQYYQGYVRVHLGAGTSGRKLAEYKLTLQAPTPTSVTSESITSTSFAVRWKMDERARQTIIFWRPRDDASSPEQSVQVTMIQNAKYRLISGLQSSTCYVARVQPLLDGKSLESAEIEVATLADPDATDPPAEPCAPPPSPSPCTIAGQYDSGDYDSDDDGLIEVCSLQQLDAIRHDLDGDGAPDDYPEQYGDHPAGARYVYADASVATRRSGPPADLPHYGDYTDAQRIALHGAAFPSAVAGMGCPAAGCIGYELLADLDFDTNGNGKADSGDAYWNRGKGWSSIMGATFYQGTCLWFHECRLIRGRPITPIYDPEFFHVKRFNAVFEGNGRTIDNLYISGRNVHAGLFGWVGPQAHIRNIGLTASNADSMVSGGSMVGALVGMLQGGIVSGSYSHVDVIGIGRNQGTGGLIGTVTMTGTSRALVIESYASGDVSGIELVGGLIGDLHRRSSIHHPLVAATFASGAVEASWVSAGGLIGYLDVADLYASYASGAVQEVDHDSSVRYMRLGALVGHARPHTRTLVRALYATGSITFLDSTKVNVGHPSWQDLYGGLFGNPVGDAQRYRNATDGYWDMLTTQKARGGFGTGKTTAELQSPTGYTGIYSAWNLDIDGDNTLDDPWDFGTTSEYPILKYCAAKPGIDLSWDTTRTEYCPLREATQHGRTYSASP